MDIDSASLVQSVRGISASTVFCEYPRFSGGSRPDRRSQGSEDFCGSDLSAGKAAFATLTTLTFLNAWNEFMGPLIFLNEKSKFTLQMGIRYFQQMFGTEYTLIMASTTMSLIPILVIYMCAQKYFIEGIAASRNQGMIRQKAGK